MNLGLAGWHRAMRAGCPPELLEELIAPDAVFHSPVVHTPQAGQAKVIEYLSAAGRVLAPADFRYVRELIDGSEACLEFTATIDRTHINGIDLITFDPAGRIVDFKVMIRPLRAIETLRERMAATLAAAERARGEGLPPG